MSNILDPNNLPKPFLRSKNSRCVDYSNQKFGRLTLLYRIEKPKYYKVNDQFYLCKCECGNYLQANIAHLKNGGIKTCRHCHKPTIDLSTIITDDLILNFNSNYTKSNIVDCWEWCGCKDLKGYGIFVYKGISYKAHRISLAINGIVIKQNEYVLHSCSNRSCVNPSHLRTGSQYENMQG